MVVGLALAWRDWLWPVACDRLCLECPNHCVGASITTTTTTTADRSLRLSSQTVFGMHWHSLRPPRSRPHRSNMMRASIGSQWENSCWIAHHSVCIVVMSQKEGGRKEECLSITRSLRALITLRHLLTLGRGHNRSLFLRELQAARQPIA